ncbi:MAG: PRC-barrel domain-containing protein [Clostridiales bacterium]|jgi:sporulation protein YlmC with PRC-barrel domain|nr:PRC-barrel domain-containing protein [Clostridiales bacterium]
MNKVSDILSKPVISLYEAKNIGTVTNILFDKKLQNAKYLLVYLDSEDDVTQKYLPFKDAGSLESDAVTVKNTSKIQSRWAVPPGLSLNPINLPIYNHNGKELGRISDVRLEGAEVLAVVAGEREYTPGVILSKSDEIVIVNDGGERIKLTPPPRIPRVSADGKKTVKVTDREKAAPVSVSAYDAAAEDRPAAAQPPAQPLRPAPPPAPADVNIPVKISESHTSVTKTPPESDMKKLGYVFLLGKIMTKSIFADNGDLIADKDCAIDTEAIERAKANNKLVHLALHSK